jgi:protein involved in polysaccharide export with SLBB domain
LHQIRHSHQTSHPCLSSITLKRWAALLACLTLQLSAFSGLAEAQSDDGQPPNIKLFDRFLKDRRESKDAEEKLSSRALSEKNRANSDANQPETAFKPNGSASQMAPTLQPGLVVSISVFAGDHKEVNESEKRISSSGTLTLPLVGTLRVGGMTVDEVSELLRTRYSEFLRAPVVDVELRVGEDGETLHPWGHVTVLGRVMRPGRIGIPATQDLTLSMAIQLAGGFDTSAKLTEIRVTRQNGPKDKRTLEVDIKEVGADGAGSQDVQLQTGDIVYIPERIL